MYCVYKAAVGNIPFAIAWDLGFGDEMDCIGRTFDAASNTLDKVAKLIDG